MGSWLVDSKAIAKKVKHATSSSTMQIKDCGAKRECPKCLHFIDNSDVSYEWPGLPAGIKFDPSDPQLLEHLAAKCGVGDVKPHALIDEFIPTLEMDKGICYTHPQDLPGATKNGSSFHFFHKTSNAYASGKRKRRKIHNDKNQESVRWHKTGRTKPVYDNGVHMGCKKIMVLYKTSEKGSKPVKSNWVMHQYHLGSEDDEREGACVASKIFYQKPKPAETEDTNVEDFSAAATPYCPKTPKILTPNPPRGSSALCDNALDDFVLVATENTKCTKIESEALDPEYLAEESQAQDPDLNDNDDSLLCKEIFSSCVPLDDSISLNDLNDGSYYTSYDLESIQLDTPPEFELTDFLCGSQDSIFGWSNKL